MAQLKFGAAGVRAHEIDLSAPVEQAPTGIPAGVIGTANRGPAFVPVTVGSSDGFDKKFGPSDGEKFGPLATYEWLRNAGSLTYVRVLGVGDGNTRTSDGTNAGKVTSAGFVVGEPQPAGDEGEIAHNAYANEGGLPGRTYFLCTLMSESAGSTVFSDAGIQPTASAASIVRGLLLAPSGVVLTLSNSLGIVDSSAPASTHIGGVTDSLGSITGSVTLFDGTTAKEEFVLLLNGHKGTDPSYPNVITASFDLTAPNYFGNVLNTDPYKAQEAGHYLYASWDVHPTVAVVTGSGVVTGAGAQAGLENSACLTFGASAYNVGSTTAPNYENWEDRFSHAKTPWVISQKFGGVAANLFRFHAIDAGAGASTSYKISIRNITPSSDPSDKYGSFSVWIRYWGDTDTNVLAVEKFEGVSLDPTSDRYIAKVIGDVHGYYDFDRDEEEQRIVIDGQYENRSNIVRVEVSTVVDEQVVDPTALPIGFRGVSHLVTSGTAPLTIPEAWVSSSVTPPVPFRESISAGAGTAAIANTQYHWGVHFEHVTSLTTKNASQKANNGVKAFAKYYPDFMLTNMNFAVGDNEGTADTTTNGILDADRFCNNLFTLENVQVVTGSDGNADSQEWASARYIRNDNITADDSAKTRAFKVTDLSVSANKEAAKFTLFMQGGFDGVNVFDRDEANLTNNAVVADIISTARGETEGPSVKAYIKALDVIKNLTNADIQVLAIPGIRNSYVTDEAVEAVEDRFDALYVMDIEEQDTSDELVRLESQTQSVANTVALLRERQLDSSFAAAYYPDVLVTDPTTRTNLYVPPSVMILGALALNDAVGYPWFAPAGLARGALSTALEPKVHLSTTNRDALADANVNPIIADPGNPTSGINPKGGVTVWGQKTLQASASALDRINVRRLLIDLRRQVRDVARTIIFEQNREATLAAFSAAVTPKLARVKALNGVTRYRVVIDSSTTTQADVENNTLRGKIYVQPTKTMEQVSIDFVVSNNIDNG